MVVTECPEELGLLQARDELPLSCVTGYFSFMMLGLTAQRWTMVGVVYSMLSWGLAG